jgi:predicted transcriptional regulator|tara:strand:+ start:241 stop:546 length:306 start_codon:yes stop_codon:yes gene_type:complete
MKKFLKQYNTIIEQDEAEVPVEEPVTPVEQPLPEPEALTLSPESEVLLVRLIKKALVTKVNPNDIDQISVLADINETNAKESLTALINIMKKYSQDIDVET